MGAIIGITGGIGCGKSIVSRILRIKGYRVYDCDYQAKLIMDNSHHIKSEICKKFGLSCLKEDGSLNRREIAGHVFGKQEHLDWLNSLVHGLIIEDVSRCADISTKKAFFVESAILRTSGLCNICNEIWIVQADIVERINRIKLRDGLQQDGIMARMKAQETEYEGFCPDIRISYLNNNEFAPLLPQIEYLIQNI